MGPENPRFRQRSILLSASRKRRAFSSWVSCSSVVRANFPAASASAAMGRVSCVTRRYSCSMSRFLTLMPNCAYRCVWSCSTLHRRLKTTSLYVTHDQVEAMTLAQRVMVMNKGIAEQIGTPGRGV